MKIPRRTARLVCEKYGQGCFLHDGVTMTTNAMFSIATAGFGTQWPLIASYLGLAAAMLALLNAANMVVSKIHKDADSWRWLVRAANTVLKGMGRHLNELFPKSLESRPVRESVGTFGDALLNSLLSMSASTVALLIWVLMLTRHSSLRVMMLAGVFSLVCIGLAKIYGRFARHGFLQLRASWEAAKAIPCLRLKIALANGAASAAFVAIALACGLNG